MRKFHPIYLVPGLFLLLSMTLNAQNYRNYEEGPLHEGYLTSVTGSVVLDAVREEPPAPINERIPPQQDPGTVWLNGYWAWSWEHNDFYWQSGTWRKPPPGRHWISGEWKKFDEGWVWIKGFWSDRVQSALTYLSDPPPDPIDENPGPPPSDLYFWFSGYWEYNLHTRDYSWLKGHWELTDENWVLVPAYYLWREGGYVFIEPYWDWPFEGLGHCYGPVWIDPPLRPGFIFDPVWVLDPIFVIHHCFFWYPDYSCWYWHHFCCHPDFWWEFPYTPSWWYWDNWWCFSWDQQWGLWWWFGNPGFPAPLWMSLSLAQQIAPPNQALIDLFKNIIGPDIITPNGVVSPNDILDSLGKDKDKPILPADKEVLDKIKEEAGKDRKIINIRPSGKKRTKEDKKTPQVRKPIVHQDGLGKGKISGTVKIPRRSTDVPGLQKPETQRKPPRPIIRTPEEVDIQRRPPPRVTPDRIPDRQRPGSYRPTPPSRRPGQRVPQYEPPQRYPERKPPPQQWYPDRSPPQKYPDRTPPPNYPDTTPDSYQPETKIPEKYPDRRPQGSIRWDGEVRIDWDRSSERSTPQSQQRRSNRSRSRGRLDSSQQGSEINPGGNYRRNQPQQDQNRLQRQQGQSEIPLYMPLNLKR